MSVYNIAIGSSRKDASPQRETWEWGQLVERMENVQYAEHTIAEYVRLNKDQKVQVKDIGYFIGGMTEKRKVQYRQLLVLDVDYCEEDTLDTLRAWLKGKSHIIHSTHSSTEEAPRYRVIAALDAAVDADKYGGLMRIVSDEFGIPVDEATMDFNRIMFLPSVPKDAKYFFETYSGEPLYVDEVLNTVDNWQDLSGVEAKTKRVQDPLKKKGIIGAFCAKISIRSVMDDYLSDVWERGTGGNYTLKGASTVNGGKIYEDLYLFSNHGTDKHRGKSHNAYDAVRLYKYHGGTAGDAAMISLCAELGIEASEGKAHSVTIELMEDEDTKVILKEKLVVDKHGNLRKTLLNASAILKYDPDLKGVFGYDLFSETPVLKRAPEWKREAAAPIKNEDCENLVGYDDMTDTDESYLRLHCEKKYDFDARVHLNDALNITQNENSFHPIRDYLESLTWDGVERLQNIFIDCFGVPESTYAKEVGIKYFVGAVRRVFIPASKMDYIPVLVSEEGMGKSRFIRRMAKLWGSDTFYTFSGGKEAYEQLRGVWIMEIPELNGIQSRGSNNRKAFVTKGEDRYRGAYLKYAKTYKRQTVFIASSNDVVFLDDPSEEGRRWWGLLCNPSRITIDVHSEAFLSLVDKYWAEAMHHFKLGVLPLLSARAEAEAQVLRKVHKVESIDQGALIEYLDMPIPSDWKEYSIQEKRHYFNNDRNNWRGKQRDYICIPMVAREFYAIERGENTTNKGREISEAISATGLFRNTGKSKRFGEYGISSAWIRKAKEISIQQEKIKKAKNN